MSAGLQVDPHALSILKNSNTIGNYKVFADGAIALRGEPPEILIGTAKLVQDTTGYSP